MAVITGKNGDLLAGGSQLLEITSWEFNPTVNNVSYASNVTGGSKKRIAGTLDGSGSFEGVMDEDNPIWGQLREGEEVTLTAVASSSAQITIPAVIDDLTFSVNIDDGEIVTFSGSFSLNGAWSF